MLHPAKDGGVAIRDFGAGHRVGVYLGWPIGSPDRCNLARVGSRALKAKTGANAGDSSDDHCSHDPERAPRPDFLIGRIDFVGIPSVRVGPVLMVILPVTLHLVGRGQARRAVVPGTAKQARFDCGEIATDEGLPRRLHLTVAAILLIPPRSGRPPAQRFKHCLVRIDFLTSETAGKFRKRIIVPLVCGVRLPQTPFKLFQIDHRPPFYNWLAHLTHPPVATSWRTNPPIHVIPIAHPNAGQCLLGPYA